MVLIRATFRSLLRLSRPAATPTSKKAGRGALFALFQFNYMAKTAVAFLMRLRRNGAFLCLAYFLATVLLSTQLRLRYMAAINGIDHYYFVVCKRYRKVVSLFGKGRIFSNMPHMA